MSQINHEIKPEPFQPAEVSGGKDIGWVLPSATEAVCRQPFSCHCMDNLQMGSTGQPGQPAATYIHRQGQKS